MVTGTSSLSTTKGLQNPAGMTAGTYRQPGIDQFWIWGFLPYQDDFDSDVIVAAHMGVLTSIACVIDYCCFNPRSPVSPDTLALSAWIRHGAASCMPVTIQNPAARQSRYVSLTSRFTTSRNHQEGLSTSSIRKIWPVRIHVLAKSSLGCSRWLTLQLMHLHIRMAGI